MQSLVGVLHWEDNVVYICFNLNILSLGKLGLQGGARYLLPSSPAIDFLYSSDISIIVIEGYIIFLLLLKQINFVA